MCSHISHEPEKFTSGHVGGLSVISYIALIKWNFCKGNKSSSDFLCQYKMLEHAEYLYVG